MLQTKAMPLLASCDGALLGGDFYVNQQMPKMVSINLSSVAHLNFNLNVCCWQRRKYTQHDLVGQSLLRAIVCVQKSIYDITQSFLFSGNNVAFKRNFTNVTEIKLDPTKLAQQIFMMRFKSFSFTFN